MPRKMTKWPRWSIKTKAIISDSNHYYILSCTISASLVCHVAVTTCASQRGRAATQAMPGVTLLWAEYGQTLAKGFDY